MKLRIPLLLVIIFTNMMMMHANEVQQQAVQQMVATISTDATLDKTQIVQLQSAVEQYYTAVRTLVAESADAADFVVTKEQLNMQFMEQLRSIMTEEQYDLWQQRRTDRINQYVKSKTDNAL